MENELLHKIWNKVSEIDDIKIRLDSIEEKVSEIDDIKTRLNVIESDLTVVKKSVITMENEHSKKIDMLLEVLVPNFKQHEAFNSRISSLEHLTDLHSYQIEDLKKAK